jgi:hypothetical protein
MLTGLKVRIAAWPAYPHHRRTSHMADLESALVAPRRFTPKVVGGIDYSAEKSSIAADDLAEPHNDFLLRQTGLSRIDDRRPARTLSPTAQNSRLRQQRREVWRRAAATTEYWSARIDFERAVVRAQDLELPEGRRHPALDRDYDMVRLWREALVKQLLTPAWDVASVNWKKKELARGEHRHIQFKSERIERAIADDLAFLASHPVGQSKRSRRRAHRKEDL